MYRTIDKRLLTYPGRRYFGNNEGGTVTVTCHGPARKPENLTGVRSQVPDHRPENRKTGPEPEAGYRITGLDTGKPDRDRKPDTR